ncbi:MAG UNVERIFIED_CONTAM: hypothetical protein LVR18_40820 [Planctomycetaceae bacterium]
MEDPALLTLPRSEAAGIVPVTGGLSNDCRESSGSIGSDGRSSGCSRCRVPKLRGLSPRPGAE